VIARFFADPVSICLQGYAVDERHTTKDRSGVDRCFDADPLHARADWWKWHFPIDKKDDRKKRRDDEFDRQKARARSPVTIGHRFRLI
jgi:hypothetical protein